MRQSGAGEATRRLWGCTRGAPMLLGPAEGRRGVPEQGGHHVAQTGCHSADRGVCCLVATAEAIGGHF